MCTNHPTFLRYSDAGASLVFDRDALGVEVHDDVQRDLRPTPIALERLTADAQISELAITKEALRNG